MEAMTTKVAPNLGATREISEETAGRTAKKAKSTAKRPCTATTQDGEPCRAWARRGSDPALCVAHMDQAYGEGVAFYRPIMTREELAALTNLAEAGVTLEGEIACTRVLIRRLIAYMNEEEPEGMALLNFAKAVFKGTAAVARLLEKERALQSVTDKLGAQAAIDKALDELAEEWGFRD